MRQLPCLARPQRLQGRPLPRGVVVWGLGQGPAGGLRRQQRELQARRPAEQVRQQVPRGQLLGALLLRKVGSARFLSR